MLITHSAPDNSWKVTKQREILGRWPLCTSAVRLHSQHPQFELYGHALEPKLPPFLSAWGPAITRMPLPKVDEEIVTRRVTTLTNAEACPKVDRKGEAQHFVEFGDHSHSSTSPTWRKHAHQLIMYSSFADVMVIFNRCFKNKQIRGSGRRKRERDQEEAKETMIDKKEKK